MNNNLIVWLESVSAEIKQIELKATDILKKADYKDEYKAIMLLKANLLAGLFDKYLQLIATDRKLANPLAHERLGAFSNGAKNALNIGSVFYMSALLYPDEHKAGEPNNLERLLADLKAQG